MTASDHTSAVLVRAGLILTATGVVSASSVRHAIDEGGDIVFAYGFLLYLLLILAAVPRRPIRYASLLAFVSFAAMYLTATADPSVFDPGLSLYVAAAGLAYLVTPARYRTLAVAAFASWTPALRFFSGEPFVGDYPISNAIAGILALFFLVLVLVVRDNVDDEERIRRIGLGLLTVATFARISERHYVVSSPGVFAPDDAWALIVVSVLPILAIVKLRRAVRDALLDPALATHLEDGTDVTTYNYPALSFLVPAPFIALGLRDIRFIYLAEIVALSLLLIREVRVPWRPLVTAAIVGNAVIMRQNVLAGVDPLWAILTVLAFLFIARRWSSPILIGLACATRQPAWFFVPFYLVAIWKRDGRPEAIRRTAIAAAAGVIPNLPFFIASPGAFLGGVLMPTLGPLEPYGVGLIRFAIDGEIPLLARGAYGVLSIGVLVGLVTLLWRGWRRLPNGTLVFPSTILWFAWRSLQNYFSFAGVFAMAGDEAIVAGEPPPAAAVPPTLGAE